MTKAVV